MGLLFILKLLVVLFFLGMFLRGSRVVWGIGLITASSALLLDTVLGVFGPEELRAQLGFFYYVFSGAIFAGAAIWLWGLLRPQLAQDHQQHNQNARPSPDAAVQQPDATLAIPPQGTTTEANAVIDRRQLYDQIRQHLGPDDVRDLIFDLELNENDVIAPQQEMIHTVRRVMVRAEQEEKLGALALAVERILTPVSPDSLPRREKLNASSPPTVLRHFLLAHYSHQELIDIASALDVDWEQLAHNNKRELVRSLLLHLYRRNRLNELVELLKSPEPSPE